MAAHVVEGAHDAVLAAHDQRALADHVHGQIVAGIRHVGDMAGDLPVVAEDVLLLEFEQGLDCDRPSPAGPAGPNRWEPPRREDAGSCECSSIVEYSFNKSIFCIELQ